MFLVPLPPAPWPVLDLIFCAVSPKPPRVNHTAAGLSAGPQGRDRLLVANLEGSAFGTGSLGGV